MKTRRKYLALPDNKRKTRKLNPKKTRKGGAKPNQSRKSLFLEPQFKKAQLLMRKIHTSSKQRNLDKKIPEDSTKMKYLFTIAKKNPYAFYAAVINKYNSLEPEEREAFAQEAMRFQMNPTISGTMVHKSVPMSKPCKYGKICIRKNPEHKLLAHNFQLKPRLKRCKNFGNPAAFIFHFFTDTC